MWTTRTVAYHDDGITNSSLAASGWSELPDDILGRLHLRLNSPRDHVRMTAVCKPWRDTASRLPATPAVPALMLSPGGGSSKKHMCGPDGSWVMRVPSKVVKKRLVGSYQGGWIAATDDQKLVIVNLFSGAEVALSAKQSTIDAIPSSFIHISENIKKIIFSEDPSSLNGCTLAKLRIKRDGVSVISVCRIGCPDGGWSELLWFGVRIRDIAFCEGELYGLTGYPEGLVKFEITMEKDGTPVITASHRLAIQIRYDPSGYKLTEYDHYIVQLHGKMMMAVRSWWLPKHKPFFSVFELVDVNDSKVYKHKWVEVTNLGDYVLFLGWSKAVHLPGGEHRGIKRNHIYYYRPTTEQELPDDKVYSVTSCDGDLICCREDKSINDGVGRIGYYLMHYKYHMWHDRCHSVAWIYPPHF